MIFNNGGGSGNAKSTKYDNTESGLQATNVQEAVDELNQSLSVDTTNLSDDYSLNNLLQLLAEKYYPNAFHYITDGVCINSFTRAGGDGTLTKTSNYLLFDGGTSVTVYYAPIDVTNYSTLQVEIEGVTMNSTSSAYGIVACDDDSTTTITNSYRMLEASRKTVSLDVSGLTGIAYFKIAGWTGMSFKVHNAWLIP